MADLMLQNKVVLITGSSRGIGAATARLAKSYGATVILHGKDESDELKRFAAELGATYIVSDVADKGAVQRSVSGLSRVDVLVNCAGITRPAPFLESTEDEWLDVFRVNVLGTVHFCKAVIPLMQKNNYGRIVNISSIRGFGPTSGKAAYATSKAAVITLTASLAKEFAPTIAVNSVAPGFTNTEMAKTWGPQALELASQSLYKRIAEPEEIGEAICFLASDRAGFITGQTLIVDGGYSISGK